MPELSLSFGEQFVTAWYQWAVAIAFAATFVISLWIFFDSDSHHYYAPLWRLLSVLAAMAVIPGAMLSFFPDLAGTLGERPPWPAYLGLAGVVLSLLVFFLYNLGIRVFDPYHPVEGMEFDFLPPAEEAEPVTPVLVRPAEARRRPTPARVAPLVQPLPPEPDVDNLMEQLPRLTPEEPEAEPPAPLAWLVIMNGQAAGQEFKLGPKTDIGRGSRHNDIALEDRAVSRQHARIRLEDEGFVLYDLASSNGVMVNNERVQRKVLKHGDRILIGETELGVLMVDESRGTARSP